MPPPGCPIPEWVYPGRVLVSRQNPNAYVWIDSIRYTPDGTFNVAVRQLLSFAPTVVNRFCMSQRWEDVQDLFAPTDQWEPHPQFAWDEALRAEFVDSDETCEIALRDGSRTWNILGMGVEGSRMTMEVSREIDPDVMPNGVMEPVEMTDRQRQLFDLRGSPPGTFVRDVLPHLMMPQAETVPMDPQDVSDHQALYERGLISRTELMDAIAADHSNEDPLYYDRVADDAEDAMPVDEQDELNEMLDQAEVDPDMRVFTASPLQGFRRVQRQRVHQPIADAFRSMGDAIARIPSALAGEPIPVLPGTLPPGIETAIQEGRFPGVSMGTMVPHQLDAPQNNPLWPVWLPYPPQDGNQWQLRVRRSESSGSMQMAFPDVFRPQDDLIWATDDTPGLVTFIGTVGDYPPQWTESQVPLLLVGGTQVLADVRVLRQLMAATMSAVPAVRPTPQEFLPGQLVSLVGGGLIGTVVATTPSGVQVHTHDGASSVVEFERGALEPYQGPSPIPYVVAIGDIIRRPDGEIIGHVTHVAGDEVTWTAGGLSSSAYRTSIRDLREQGGIFERPNRAVTPDIRIRRPEAEKRILHRPTVYDRILEDDDD